MSGTGREVVHVVYIVPVGLEVGLQGSFADGVLQVIQGLGIERGLGEFGIGAQTHGTQVAGTYGTVGRTEGVTGSREGDAGVQTLGEHFIHAVGAGSGGRSAGIRQVRDGLFQIGQDLLEDHVTVFLGHVDGFRSYRCETGRNISPGLD